MDTNKTCERCNTTVTSKNCARHLRSQKHLRNYPDQTLRLRRRRIPEKHDVTRKELLSQAKEYGLKGFTK